MSVTSMERRITELKRNVAAIDQEYLVGGGREWPLIRGREGGSRGREEGGGGREEGRGGEGSGGGKGGEGREERRGWWGRKVRGSRGIELLMRYCLCVFVHLFNFAYFVLSEIDWTYADAYVFLYFLSIVPI